MARFLLPLLLLAAFALGQESPGAPSSGEVVDKGVLVKLLEAHPKSIWAYFPALEDREVAEALWRRMLKGRPLVLLLPDEEIHNPLSYSNTFFLGQLLYRNVQVRHLRLPLEARGDDPIYILEGEGVYVGTKKVPKEEEGTYLVWWRRAWKAAKAYDPLRYARDLYMKPRREAGRED